MKITITSRGPKYFCMGCKPTNILSEIICQTAAANVPFTVSILESTASMIVPKQKVNFPVGA
jgi:hypothetical protein